MAKFLLCFSGRRSPSPGPAPYGRDPAAIENSAGKPWDGPVVVETGRSDAIPLRVWEGPGPARHARELECSSSLGTSVHG